MASEFNTPPTLAAAPPTTEDLVAFLSSPDAYDGMTDAVEVRETHMSWVFLTDAFVYKLKKPVCSAYLDFSTPEARQKNCLEEVRLNRRLAANVYLGVVAITREKIGGLALNGIGETVDWVVKMHRLPADRMLDAAINSGSVTPDHIEDVAELLIGFFKTLEPAGIAVADYLSRLRHQLHEDRAILCNRRFNLPVDLPERVLDRLINILEAGQGYFGDALPVGRIVEGHGDLRPEHVCLLDPPVIIDCLEFNRGLRLVDPFDDVAYLALECGFIGAPWIGDLLITRISEGLGVKPAETLVAFYTACRASLRARLSLAHLLDAKPRTPEKWMPQTIAYLEIADRESARLPVPEAR
jgi:aminoglycoside phosphotransferase family enzyme